MDYLFNQDGASDPDSNEFTIFVLSKKHYTSQEFSRLNASLAKDPNSTSLLLSSETNRAFFLSDFSERIQRILAWVQYITESSAPSRSSSISSTHKNIIHNFAANIIVPLLEPEYSEFHTFRGFTDLIISVTNLTYIHRNKGIGVKIHKTILEKVSKSPYLIRRILPSVDGAQLLKTILAEAQSGAEIRSFGSARTLAEWTKVAVELCQGCRDDHLVKEELGRWTCVLDLQESLTRILKVHEEKQRQAPQQSVARGDFTGMRVLSADDKKSGNWTAAHSRRASLQLPDISLSPEDHCNLGRLSMRPPTGIGAVEAILTRLQEPETFVLFEAFVKSFPCVHCLRDKVPAPIASGPRKLLLTTNLPTSFTSTLFGPKLGPWRVCLSENAFEDIRSASKEGHSTRIANKLSALASGHWDTESLRRPLSKDLLEAVQEKEKVPLWTAVYGVDGRILWQVNVGFDEEVNSNCQMITVWRIGNQDEVEKTVRDVLILQRSYTISQVQERRVRIRDFPVLPKTCGQVDHARRRSVQLGGIYETVLEELDEAFLKEPDEAVLEAQEALMSNKFYCVSGKVLDRLFASYDSVEFPFDISMEETEIIKHSNTAAFIQGRSGTGKTSCLLFKLLCRNIASRENEGTSVRQIFLTRSSYLAERLKEYLQRLLNSQLGILSAPVKPDIPQAQEYTIKAAKDPLENLTLDNISEDKFPLVCTFGQLFNFLERTIRYNDRKDFTSLTSHANTADAGRVSRRIDYKAFRTQYWRKHFYGHSRRFEPELVFSEIIGTIKGSTSAHRSFEPLSKEDYISLSHRKAPVFTEASDRYVIYELYRDYERNKTVLGHQDDIDRVTYLLKSLEKDQHLKRRVQSLFDEVYVDELQDNRLLELDLLLTLVRSPNGIHFAGDTAQCISRDNTFRFQDVKARFYEHFKDMANEARKPSWARPELFQLATNYRSHQGILSLAADIVEMLCNAFPSQIDSLPREVGNYPGAMPTVFVGFDHRILAQGGAGMMGTEEGLGCFGAEQAIIVRDEDVQTELRALLPSTTILTIFESKGLEFEDVILYNFFCNTVWANVGVHVLKQLLQKGAADELDTGKYGMLCSELKHLYVAVTRARKNLWIVENDPASVQNILTVWTMTEKEPGRNPIVSIVDANEKDAQRKARNIIKPGKCTTPDAWRKQGEMFLHRDLYQEALRCFRRAGHRQGQALARAFLMYQDAQALDIAPDALSMEARELYEQAATLFEEGSFIDKAAEAWAAMENYKKAAQVLQADKNYGKAARYYEKAEEFLQAGTCYDLADQYDDAVRVYRKGEHFPELIEYLGRRQQRISNDVRTRYSTLVNILLQRGDLQLPDNMMSAAVDTLGDDDKKEKFYKDFNRTEDLLEFYRRKKRYHEAFMLALSEGKFQYAVRLAEEPEASTAGREFSIPMDDILTLFNGLMAGNTWSAMGINFQTVSQLTAVSSLGPSTIMAGDLSSTNYTAPALHKSQSRWKQILACILAAKTGLKLDRPGASGSSPNYLGEIETNFLDLAELLRLNLTLRDRVGEVKNFAQLPVATLSKFAILTGNLLGDVNRSPPPGFLTCVGALLVHLPDSDPNSDKVNIEAVVFNWSPLFPASTENGTIETSQRGYTRMTVQQVHDTFKSWLINVVVKTIPIALSQMRVVLRGIDNAKPCFDYLQGGACRKEQTGQCKSDRHTKLPTEEIKGEIFALLDATGLACSSLRLYLHRKLNADDSKAYQGNKRAFLEVLLKQLTFISPFLNDSVVQQQIWKMLLESREWPHVRDGLESLFFHRLRPQEWQQRTTISAILEERNFASKLGAIQRFGHFLFNMRMVNQATNNVYSFLLDAEKLQPYRVPYVNTVELVRCIHRVTTFITSRVLPELQSLHSVLSLFELLSLELLNRITRQDFLVPLSLRHLVRDLSNHPVPNEGEQYNLEQSLFLVLRSLCDVLLKFAAEYRSRKLQKERAGRPGHLGLGVAPRPDALFNACGRPLWNGNRYMIRRGLDHLALCMINFRVARRFNPPEYQDLWQRIMQVCVQWDQLRPPTLVNWFNISSDRVDQLAIQLVNAYRVYNKDKLVIIEGSQSTRMGSSRYQFLSAAGIEVLPRSVQSAPPTSREIQRGTEEDSDASRIGEVMAVSKIVRWWRRCSIRIKARKENAMKRAEKLASGPQGEAEVIVEDIIARADAIKSCYRQQRAILQSIGVSFLKVLIELGTLTNTTHAMTMEALTNRSGQYRLSSNFVEYAQDLIGQLDKHRKYVSKSKTEFTTREAPALLKMSPGEGKKRMDTALERLKGFYREVECWKTQIEEGLESGQ